MRRNGREQLRMIPRTQVFPKFVEVLELPNKRDDVQLQLHPWVLPKLYVKLHAIATYPEGKSHEGFGRLDIKYRPTRFHPQAK
jgi:hypothetical protein